MANRQHMSTTTDFISELIRATNEIGKVSVGERMKLMSRGSRTIREMRLQTGVRHGPGKDALNDLEIAARKCEKGSDDDAKAVLLGMAAMIRTLKIVLDAKDEVLRGGR